MANKRAENFLINLNWKKDIFDDFEGDIDYSLAGKRLVYLFLSMEEIMTNENGKQVSSGDMSVDWVVKGLINQEMRMRGETDKVDAKIAALKAKGLKSQAIAEVLAGEGIKLSDSGIRKKDGWKHFEKYLKPEEQQL